MRTDSLIRWGGFSALLSGTIGIIGEIVLFFTEGDLSYSEKALTPVWFVFIVVLVLAAILSVLGLVALFARQYHSMRKWSVVAFALALAGTMMVLGHQWAGLFVVPLLAERAPELLNTITTDTTSILAGGIVLSVFLMAVGWILFGLASLRARIFPAGSVWMVIIGAVLILVLSLIDFDLEKVIFNLGLAWIGWWLWSEPKRRTT